MKRLDLSTLAGVLLAASGIVAGLLLDHGSLRDLGQITAALIVLGGTAGALLISTPQHLLWRALRRSRAVLAQERPNLHKVADRILRLATIAHRHGILSIEAEALKTAEPLLRKGLMQAVDGSDTAEIRRTLDQEIQLEANRADQDAAVFETAGGYAPTIGIVGAVLGLIQVMKHLEKISQVGSGIAVAFVATVYGVGFANLILFPIAAKLRALAEAERELRELEVEGVLAISEGLNPHLVRTRLEAHLDQPFRQALVVLPGGGSKVAS